MTSSDITSLSIRTFQITTWTICRCISIVIPSLVQDLEVYLSTPIWAQKNLPNPKSRAEDSRGPWFLRVPVIIKINLDCPCNTNCPNGCAGCRHPICDEHPICGGNDTDQNKENLEMCTNEKSIDLGQCIIDCGNNQLCERSCVELFKTEHGKCPCQVFIRLHLNHITFF